MKTVCEEKLCNGCMACLEKCQYKAIRIERKVEYYNAIINEQLCVNCHACQVSCPRNDDNLPFKQPVAWYQGWADDTIRNTSTSGGAAASILQAFIKSGGYVCSCLFKDGDFVFKISSNISDVNFFKGSKYVKSNPEGIYNAIQGLLRRGKRVLFVGLPCQVAAVKKFVSKKLHENLYTIDLICHGTPALRVFEKYLNDHGYNIRALKDVQFRAKNDFRVYNDYKPIVMPGISDRYIYSFLKKMIYTENCYHCQFASLGRISDLTLGDSWGSSLEKKEKDRGISLLLAQTEKGRELIGISGLTLFEVDLETAVKNNTQLQKPADKSIDRDRFLLLFNRGTNYDRIVFKIAPIVFLKQDLKMLLAKLHLISLGGGITYIVSVLENDSTYRRV